MRLRQPRLLSLSKVAEMKSSLSMLDLVTTTPCEILLKEAQNALPDKEFNCIISVGTGIGGSCIYQKHSQKYS